MHTNLILSARSALIAGAAWLTARRHTAARNALLKVFAFALIVNLQPIAAYGGSPIGDTAALESIIQSTSLIARTPFESGRRRIKVIATAYSSTPDQTDDTPYTTASNTTVRDGIVASSFLPFGTKLKIPSLYGDKIFVVEDSMNRRYEGEYRLDVWHTDRASAKEFGVRRIEIVIL